eukprot:CAMPEP_0177649830 /NCGR_PEP_ID=MMETSP0447-20121125/11604_1 /TAXON_ID=0 /ORGANISM="Stygamoeba regulata, Strain BSH-02190019" /LENGTH=117 /DNA_ID=CAMNT_0019152631 /DNA_START=223 /DNA_END=573 /DNA_ORIENTATION=+
MSFLITISCCCWNLEYTRLSLQRGIYDNHSSGSGNAPWLWQMASSCKADQPFIGSKQTSHSLVPHAVATQSVVSHRIQSEVSARAVWGLETGTWQHIFSSLIKASWVGCLAPRSDHQ